MRWKFGISKFQVFPSTTPVDNHKFLFATSWGPNPFLFKVQFPRRAKPPFHALYLNVYAFANFVASSIWCRSPPLQTGWYMWSASTTARLWRFVHKWKALSGIIEIESTRVFSTLTSACRWSWVFSAWTSACSWSISACNCRIILLQSMFLLINSHHIATGTSLSWGFIISLPEIKQSTKD